MEILAYVIRCIFMFFVTWTGVRLIGKKSIANMTAYDLAALMLLTTVAAEPLVFKITTKATVGVIVITICAIIIGGLSLMEYFYNLDSIPSVIISNGKILKKELKKNKINIPLLMSELRLQGYQDLSNVAYAILEPNGKLSIIPKSQSRPVQPSDLTLNTSSTRLSFPIIIDGKLKQENLKFLKQDTNWLKDQLKMYQIERIEDVLYAQVDSSGNIYMDLKEKEVELPVIF